MLTGSPGNLHSVGDSGRDHWRSAHAERAAGRDWDHAFAAGSGNDITLAIRLGTTSARWRSPVGATSLFTDTNALNLGTSTVAGRLNVTAAVPSLTVATWW